MKYQPLSLARNEIRLLSVLPAAASDLTVVYELFNISLDRAPSFKVYTAYFGKWLQQGCKIPLLIIFTSLWCRSILTISSPYSVINSSTGHHESTCSTRKFTSRPTGRILDRCLMYIFRSILNEIPQSFVLRKSVIAFLLIPASRHLACSLSATNTWIAWDLRLRQRSSMTDRRTPII